MTVISIKHDTDLHLDTVRTIDLTAFHRHDSLTQTQPDKKENKSFHRFAFLKFLAPAHCTHIITKKRSTKINAMKSIIISIVTFCISKLTIYCSVLLLILFANTKFCFAQKNSQVNIKKANEYIELANNEYVKCIALDYLSKATNLIHGIPNTESIYEKIQLVEEKIVEDDNKMLKNNIKIGFPFLKEYSVYECSVYLWVNSLNLKSVMHDPNWRFRANWSSNSA